MSTTPYAAHRACDQCRLRKIRCDGRQPCAQCVTSNQHCSSTGVGRKHVEAKQRVLVSTQYEEKIDRLEAGLLRIEQAINRLTEAQMNVRSPDAVHTAASNNYLESPTVAFVVSVEAEAHHATSELTFEGNGSMAAHVSFARSFAERAVENGSQNDTQRELQSALSALHQLLQTHPPKDETPLSHQLMVDQTELAGLRMPPVELVLATLRESKQTTPVTFTLICAFGTLEFFSNHCQKVYFATENFSQATFIIVNAGLYFILAEKMLLAKHRHEDATIELCESSRDICRANLETVLPRLNMILPAKRENIVALIMAASYMIEISKPSIAWRLNTAACQLCLTLGYHRGSRLVGESSDTQNCRTILFWLAYILDKALALRLGRTSILQDSEITLSRTLSPFIEFDVHRSFIQTWMVHAEVQGQIYERLFSPVALEQSASERARIARVNSARLSEEMRLLQHRRTQLQREPLMSGAAGGIKLMLLRSDELALASTLTLVHRAIEPKTSPLPSHMSTTFTHECIQTARQAIELHLETVAMIAATPMLATAYIHW
jgi:hypothetical protein